MGEERKGDKGSVTKTRVSAGQDCKCLSRAPSRRTEIRRCGLHKRNEGERVHLSSEHIRDKSRKADDGRS